MATPTSASREAPSATAESSSASAHPEATMATSSNSGAAPAVVAPPSTSRDKSGYYAALGLSPGASASQIRKGYLRRALATHPDKPGGSDALIQVVNAAFETLGDAEKMEQYDGPNGGGSCHDDGSVFEPSRDSEDLAAVRFAYASLIMAPASSRSRILATMGMHLLEPLKEKLQQADALNWSKSSSEVMPWIYMDDASAGGVGTSNKKKKGVTRRGARGYNVKVSWRAFHIETALAVRDLEGALKLHVLLMQVKDVAVARHRRFKKDLLCFGSIDSEGRDDDCPPLLEEELLQLFSEIPDVPLRFSSDLRKPVKSNQPSLATREKRIQSPFTPSLAAASQNRCFIRRVLAQDYKAVAGPDHIHIIKEMMEKQAKEAWKVRQGLEASLIKEVSTVMEQRKQSASGTQQVVPVVQAALLSLEDRSLAEQAVQVAHAAVEAQKIENEHLRGRAQRAAEAEQTRSLEAAQLKDAMASMQVDLVTKEIEAKAALEAKVEAEQRATSQTEMLRQALLALHPKPTVAVRGNEELEQEVLNQQRKINKLEREKSTALRGATQGVPEFSATQRGGSSAGIQDTRITRQVTESINAANRQGASYRQGNSSKWPASRAASSIRQFCLSSALRVVRDE